MFSTSLDEASVSVLNVFSSVQYFSAILWSMPSVAPVTKVIFPDNKKNTLILHHNIT